MELTPGKFLLLFLLLAFVGYIVFTCAARLFAWVISRTIGGDVFFRVAGLNGLKEISIQLQKGPVASFSIGELKWSFRKPPGTRGWNVFAWTSKVQIVLCDVEVVLRNVKKNRRVGKSHKHNLIGRGKWMLITNIVKNLSISVNEIAVKFSESSKATLEVKDLDLDTFKEDAGVLSLGVKLFLAPCFVYLGDDDRMHDDSSIFCIRDKLLSVGRVPEAEAHGRFVVFALDQLALTGNLDHDRDAGVVVKQVEVACGDANVNLRAGLMFEENAGTQDGLEDIKVPEAHRESIPSDLSARVLAKRVPETVHISLSKFQLNFHHQMICMKNELKSICLRSTKSRPVEGSVDVISSMDIQVELGEIHLIKQRDALVDIAKVAVSASVEFPAQLNRPLRAEVDVKLGGTQCNFHMNRYGDWVQVSSLRRPRDAKSGSRSARESALRICWSCSVSAPELAVIAYNVDDVVLMQISSQTSHIYLNAPAKTGTVVHAELGEIYVNLLEEGKRRPIETGVDGCSNSLLHLSRVSFDSGLALEGEAGLSQTPLSIVEAGTAEVYLQQGTLKAAVLALIAVEACIKRFPRVKQHKTRVGHRRADKIRFEVEKLLVYFSGSMHVEEIKVPDPKKVNFGSQGGMVVVTNQDSGPRSAYIKSPTYNGVSASRTKQNLSLAITQIRVTLDPSKETTVMELGTGSAVYEETAPTTRSITRRTLLSLENVKVVRQPAKGTKEPSRHSLLTASNVSFHWNPDVHLLVYGLVLDAKKWLRTQRTTRGAPLKQEDKQELFASKIKTAFALDIEEMSVTGEIADGVDGSVRIKSIFSEDAAIGMLFENIDVALNKASVARAERLQVSRVPSVVTQDAKLLHEKGKNLQNLWDIIIQGTGTRIIMPYRLPLRAIEDAVEDMWRGLKLSMVAKRIVTGSNDFQGVTKIKRTPRLQIYSVKLHMRGITAEIEEEPLQGWLDEHYHLLKQQSRELLVRERFLEESSKGRQEQLTAKLAWEQLQEQTFQAYKRACTKLNPSKGSGACRKGFQSGFRPSTKRVSLMSISATVLDVTLTDIPDGRKGAIDLIRRLDCLKRELDVPFSRIISRHISVSMSSLAVNLRDFTVPMLSASSGKCEGSVIFAQQATRFQSQVLQDVFIGRWRRIQMWRSISGSTPPFKFYSELPIQLESAKVGYGVGYEPALADVSYAFTVALKKYNLSARTDYVPPPPPVKKEKSLPWWDDMRYYIHGVNSISASGFEWIFLATTNPYENQDMMRMVSSTMRIDQTDGKLSFMGSNFDMYISSLESLAPVVTTPRRHQQFIHAPVFKLDIVMDWACASGDSFNHYLHAFPQELQPRAQVYDPFRSTSLSLLWSFSLQTNSPGDYSRSSSRRNKKGQKLARSSLERLKSFSRVDIPFMNLCSPDLTWIFKWWSLYFNPPHKLRSFSRWPRYQVERVPRSGNLSLDKVMTEFILRVDATPSSIKHFSLADDDPARGLTFSMQKLRYELCFSRGKQEYTFECKRDILDLVYQGLDVHLLKAKLKRSSDDDDNVDVLQRSAKVKQLLGVPESSHGDTPPKHGGSRAKLEDGFLLSTDCFTIRRQSPKADPKRLSPWRESVQLRGSELFKLSESDSGASDPACSDDDGFGVVLADNCLRVSLYGFKLFWTIPNRNVVWAWAGDISKAFEAPKPSASRQYAQRKLLEEKQRVAGIASEREKEDGSSSASREAATAKAEEKAEEEEGTLQFMVNIVQPQFNLHSEDAHGRFLLAAASGRVLARSIHSLFYLGFDEIAQALEKGVPPPQGLPEISWKRRELSVLLEHVQAHVAPTDVDPGAGLQWLPRIPRELQVKRTGALLERVFLPCSMYFQYTRHKGGTTDCKVKPLKELSFNSPEIAATMTSRQFHIMVDVMSSLLLARLPKPHRGEEEEEIEEAADEVVPDGVEEVELARIRLEKAERDIRLTYDDLKTIKQQFRGIASPDGISSPEQHSAGESPEGSLRKALTRTSALVRRLEFDLAFKRKSRKAAYASLRLALQKAAQQSLMDKEKNKSPSAAMRISWAINRVAWTMLTDGEPFAEAEINSLILNVDRDFRDNGVARFIIKSFVVKNCLLNATSNTVLSAWNPPAEWGKNVMLRVDVRQGPPKEGVSLFELFQVEIYPLKIHLTETMYTMMWDYFFPGDEQDAQKRKEVWIGSTNSVRRSKKGVAAESSAQTKPVPKAVLPEAYSFPALQNDASRLDFVLAAQALRASKSQHLEHHRSSSFDKAWEETELDCLATETLVRTATAPTDEILAALYASNTAESKLKRATKTNKGSQEEKKESRNRKIFLEIHNIKFSQVELLVTYEGSKFSVGELKLLMDTFTRNEFVGSWRRLFSRVKKHIIWGVLKSVTGMQGKKFKDRTITFEESDSNSGDSCGTAKLSSRERFPIPLFQKDRAGEGFVSSIRGLFNSQKRKAKALVRTMRREGYVDVQHEWRSDGETDLVTLARQLNKSKSKLLRRHSRKVRSKGAILLGDRYYESSPRASPPYHSDAESSSGSSTYEDFEQHFT